MSFRSNRYHSPVRSSYGTSPTYTAPLSLYGFSPSSYGVSTGYSSRSRLYSPSSHYTSSFSPSPSYSPSAYSYKSRYRDTTWSSYYTSAPRSNWYEAYKPTVRQRPSFSSDYSPASSRRSSGVNLSPSQSTKANRSTITHGTISRQRKTIKFVEPKRKDSVPLDLAKIRRLSDTLLDTQDGEEAGSGHSPRRSPMRRLDAEESILEEETKKDGSVDAPGDVEAKLPNEERQERQSRARRRSRDVSAQDKKARRVSMEISDVISEEDVQKQKLNDDDIAPTEVPPFPPTPPSSQEAEKHPQVVMEVTHICDKKFEVEAKQKSKDLLKVEQGKRSLTPEVVIKIPRRIRPAAVTAPTAVEVKMGVDDKSPEQENISLTDIQHPAKKVKKHERSKAHTDNRNAANVEIQLECSLPSPGASSVLDSVSCATPDASKADVSTCRTFCDVVVPLMDNQISTEQPEVKKTLEAPKRVDSSTSKLQQSCVSDASNEAPVKVVLKHDKSKDGQKKQTKLQAATDCKPSATLERKVESNEGVGRVSGEATNKGDRPQQGGRQQVEINLQQDIEKNDTSKGNGKTCKIAVEEKVRKNEERAEPSRVDLDTMKSANQTRAVDVKPTHKGKQKQLSLEAKMSNVTTVDQPISTVAETTSVIQPQEVKSEESAEFRLGEAPCLPVETKEKHSESRIQDTAKKTGKVDKIVKDPSKHKVNKTSENIPKETKEQVKEEKNPLTTQADQKATIVNSDSGKSPAAVEQTTDITKVKPDRSHGKKDEGNSSALPAIQEARDVAQLQQIDTGKQVERTQKTKLAKRTEAKTKITDATSTDEVTEPKIGVQSKGGCEKAVSEAKVAVEQEAVQEKVQEIAANEKEERIPETKRKKDKDRIVQKNETKIVAKGDHLRRAPAETDNKPPAEETKTKHKENTETAAITVDKVKPADAAAEHQMTNTQTKGKDKTVQDKLKAGKEGRSDRDGDKQQHPDGKGKKTGQLEDERKTERRIEHSKEELNFDKHEIKEISKKVKVEEKVEEEEEAQKVTEKSDIKKAAECHEAKRATSLPKDLVKKDPAEKKPKGGARRDRSTDVPSQIEQKSKSGDSKQRTDAKGNAQAIGPETDVSKGTSGGEATRRTDRQVAEKVKHEQGDINDGQQNVDVSIPTTEAGKVVGKIEEKPNKGLPEKSKVAESKATAEPLSAGKVKKIKDLPKKDPQMQKEKQSNQKQIDTNEKKIKHIDEANRTPSEISQCDIHAGELETANKAPQPSCNEAPSKSQKRDSSQSTGHEALTKSVGVAKTAGVTCAPTDEKVSGIPQTPHDERTKKHKQQHEQKPVASPAPVNEDTPKQRSEKGIQAVAQTKAQPSTVTLKEVSESQRPEDKRRPPKLPKGAASEQFTVKTKDDTYISVDKKLEKKITFIQQSEIQHSASAICLLSNANEIDVAAVATAGKAESKGKSPPEVPRKPPPKMREKASGVVKAGEADVPVAQEANETRTKIKVKPSEEKGGTQSLGSQPTQNETTSAAMMLDDHLNVQQKGSPSSEPPKALALKVAVDAPKVEHSEKKPITNGDIHHAAETVSVSDQRRHNEPVNQNDIGKASEVLHSETVAFKPPKPHSIKEHPKPPKPPVSPEERPASTSAPRDHQAMLDARLNRGHSSEKAMLERRATDEMPRLKGTEQQPIIRYRKYSLLDFNLLKVLGKGSFGKVFLVELRDVPIYFAMKCLKKDVVLEDDDVECTLVERQVLSLGSHSPFVCKLFCTFQTESHLFFVMEFLRGGDLMFHVQNEGSFTEDRARFYGAEIVCALKFLHRRGIVYRDLKLDNVCLDGDGHIRLIDFGMCVLRVYRYEPTAFCGTPEYMAPEVIEGKQYSYPVDWWSFGVVMYEMLRGRSPYMGCDEDELFWNVMNTEVEYPKYFSREAKDLIQNLLQRDPENRLGTPECGRGDIRDHPFFDGINWAHVERKQLTPHFKPFIHGASDVSNFDEDFTREPAVLTPVTDDVLASMDQELFKEFSYTNPNMTT